MKNDKTIKKVNAIRHNEYYDTQELFDELYEKSRNNEIFTNLTPIIVSEKNILLAYRNIKNNQGSVTPGVDKKTIEDIGTLPVETVVQNVRYYLLGSQHGYRPKPVRRIEIPKQNGKLRPLGIPCIWDRLIQQCIKQVMEPICEAKFSDNSYGFRPDRCVEHAIHRFYQLIQISHLYNVVEFDIQGFFDNVNHSKLIKQIWSMGIHDKTLIYLIKRILKAPIKLQDGTIIIPEKGTPQGGILSPLLANIVLNELDHWVESQWQENPVCYKWKTSISNSGGTIKPGYRLMRTTNLKEMFIVRYADDFCIFCRTREQARKIKLATTKWLNERLKLNISEEKTRIVNVKSQYAEFLGFKIRAHKKGDKWVVMSHVQDDILRRELTRLKEQIVNIAHPRPGKREIDEIIQYNSMVMGMQNYYKFATEISEDFGKLNFEVLRTLKGQLNFGKRNSLRTTGRKLSQHEQIRYGKSKMLRYVAGTNEPIYPIGYVRHQKPIAKKRSVNRFTKSGREEIHKNLSINTKLLHRLMNAPTKGKSVEYIDNRISLFSAQMGKCAITGDEFHTTEEIHCHHIIPKYLGGNDGYDNLIIIHQNVHKLVHARNQEMIKEYLSMLNLTKQQVNQVNELRIKCKLNTI